jgi:hypothetical protein
LKAVSEFSLNMCDKAAKVCVVNVKREMIVVTTKYGSRMYNALCQSYYITLKFKIFDICKFGETYTTSRPRGY